MLAFFQNATPVAVTSCSGMPTRPIARPGRAISSAVRTACCTKSARQLADRIAAKEDDLLGSKPPRGDHTAQRYRAVADDCDVLARTDLRGDRGVMARPHHIP
jgi:hypothetical protein